MEITGKTKIMFVLAHPVDHVRASAVLNTYFQSIDDDVAVSPLHVLPADLGAVLASVRLMRNVVGFGVTIPHKTGVIEHLDETTPTAALIGAVNFVKRTADGRLIGDNLDARGFVASLAQHQIAVRGRKVLQVGAGGAGRATAFGLAEAGARELTIMNRDGAKAHALAEAVSRRYPETKVNAGRAEARAFDLIVNTTSLGMKTDDPLPLDIEGVGPATAVSDIIVTPEVTRLLEQAAAQGARTIGGKPMLDAQMALVARSIAR
ncbi:shikimate dehydrogenase [Bradyrhizobium diazoefficiens]|uniref:shikimate dehydrogenase (NADP(+)) n=1 Tax=Bradyrhizobium diazoefficiens TaxID=1355477 RepID=A0A0E4FYP3_9BRAD|nr:shikimate dehydrogenase [Bradyrhizobium diazoefficiens]MBR0866062.1 shikimate dehydrogenase [Bradyrhizobium diazoefficiens]MBR0890585.1 shikimate dehydrogenase [Bradyrhizobium diazoefficiens]MBR0922354.1 shikimate dehydrogenase [Bradyrhizobium diazoefficiens]BAR60787.1 putative shikimate 5-dehydrogenase [Bradyrhizobium diazoefficiens]